MDMQFTSNTLLTQTVLGTSLYGAVWEFPWDIHPGLIHCDIYTYTAGNAVLLSRCLNQSSLSWAHKVKISKSSGLLGNIQPSNCCQLKSIIWCLTDVFVCPCLNFPVILSGLSNSSEHIGFLLLNTACLFLWQFFYAPSPADCRISLQVLDIDTLV